MPDSLPLPLMQGLKKRRSAHVLLHQAQARELTKASKICSAALRISHRAPLEARGITRAVVDKLLSDIDSCRQRSLEAFQQTLLKESHTAEEGLAKKALLKALIETQSAAKQKYARTDPGRLHDYCVGKDLDASRASLEQYSQVILEKLGGALEPSNPSPDPVAPGPSPVAADTLPGITPEKVAALNRLRRRWMEIQAEQAQTQMLATRLRAERDALVQVITDQRIQIQFAAEAEWPPSEPASAGRRRAFLLQPNRPFSLAA